MEIKMIKVGYLRCNCYVLVKNGKALVIDPGDEFEKIKELIGNNKVVGVVVTHHHFDHDGAMDDIIREYKTKLYDFNNLSEGVERIDDFEFEVIYTPGHKKDLITLYFRSDKCMFTGDFIFKNSIGRCDLQESNIDEMNKSLNKIKMYDGDIKIYPGHGVSSTLGDECLNNVFFKNGL